MRGILPEDSGAGEFSPRLVTQLRCECRTLAEGQRVADMIAAMCPRPLVQLPGLLELIVNAIEHGNLEIGFDEKNALLQKGSWLDEIERRSRSPEYSARRVSVGFERTSHDVSITIRDDGKGFDSARFLNAAPSEDLALHGRGIAIAKRLSFDAMEYRGSGSEVRVRVGLVPADMGVAVQIAADETVANEATRKPRVLIADDEPVTRMLLVGALHGEFDVVCAIDGQDALDKYVALRPDLMLVDVQMPRLSGCDVCERIRRDESDRRTPILLMSAQDGESFVLDGLARGADDFIVKPFNQRVLLSKIHAQLASKNTRDALALQRERLLDLQRSTAHEYFVAQAVLKNIIGRAELNHPSVEYSMTGMGVFEGDVALVAKLPTGGLRFMVSDVAGHGLPAALGTIPLSLLFYSTTRRGVELGAAMMEINRELCGVLPVGLFAAGAGFEVSADATRLRVWNGGIPDLVLCRQGSRELTRFASRNLPIGIADQDVSVVEDSSVAPGDVLFAMSDGVIEARDAGGQLFGMERVIETLSADRPLPELFGDLRRALARHGQGRQHDDVTLLAHTITKATD